MKPKTEVIIEIKNLTKKFKYITAVNDLNLEIFKGEILECINTYCTNFKRPISYTRAMSGVDR